MNLNRHDNKNTKIKNKNCFSGGWKQINSDKGLGWIGSIYEATLEMYVVGRPKTSFSARFCKYFQILRRLPYSVKNSAGAESHMYNNYTYCENVNIIVA